VDPVDGRRAEVIPLIRSTGGPDSFVQGSGRQQRSRPLPQVIGLLFVVVVQTANFPLLLGEPFKTPEI
jgi:hypothetical protein